MKSFAFRLQPLLNWRTAQRAAAEAQLERMVLEKNALEGRLGAVVEAAQEARRDLASHGSARGADLEAVARFCAYAADTAVRLGAQILACERNILEQRKLVLLREREQRLLEELRKHKYSEWTYECNREMESLAGDVYRAALVRKRRQAQARGTT